MKQTHTHTHTLFIITNRDLRRGARAQERVFYMSEKILKHAGHVPKKSLLSSGVCLGKAAPPMPFGAPARSAGFLLRGSRASSADLVALERQESVQTCSRLPTPAVRGSGLERASAAAMVAKRCVFPSLCTAGRSRRSCMGLLAAISFVWLRF